MLECCRNEWFYQKCLLCFWFRDRESSQPTQISIYHALKECNTARNCFRKQPWDRLSSGFFVPPLSKYYNIPRMSGSQQRLVELTKSKTVSKCLILALYKRRRWSLASDMSGKGLLECRPTIIGAKFPSTALLDRWIANFIGITIRQLSFIINLSLVPFHPSQKQLPALGQQSNLLHGGARLATRRPEKQCCRVDSIQGA